MDFSSNNVDSQYDAYGIVSIRGEMSYPTYARYNIKFPITDPHQLAQDESYFLCEEKGKEIKIRFHDYGEIYNRPGLYEQLFYKRLRCNSPKKVAEILSKVLRENRIEMSELRVLDLGAGNGMFGEQLQAVGGVARVIGADICKEARIACERDRAGIYDAYYIGDFSNLQPAMHKDVAAWQFDGLSCVAALGFGDIPATTFANAYNMLAKSGWVAFNIKETFLLENNTSTFAFLIKSLLLSDAFEVYHLERYQHRISIDGRPLFYYVLVGKKVADIPEEIMTTINKA